MAKKVKLVLVGFGNVGRALSRIIASKKEMIESKLRVSLKVTAVIDSKGAAVKDEGFTPQELLKLTEVPRSGVSSFMPYGVPGAGVKEVYDVITPDIHIEATPSNYVNGEPGVSNVLYALGKGVNVVSCNKSPFALRFHEVMELAEARNLGIGFKATVMGGVPLLDLLRSLKGIKVKSVEGILNATANYILTEMSRERVTFDEALRRARQAGLVEANSDLDIKGWDPAAKLVIISNMLGEPLKLEDVSREDLSKILVSDVIEATKKGYIIKYVATLNLAEGSAAVYLRKLPEDDFLARTSGKMNAVKIRTEINELMLAGNDLGPESTAYGVLDDVITLARKLSNK